MVFSLGPFQDPLHFAATHEPICLSAQKSSFLCTQYDLAPEPMVVSYKREHGGSIYRVRLGSKGLVFVVWVDGNFVRLNKVPRSPD